MGAVVAVTLADALTIAGRPDGVPNIVKDAALQVLADKVTELQAQRAAALSIADDLDRPFRHNTRMATLVRRALGVR